MSSTSGIVDPGESDVVSVDFFSVGLQEGTYNTAFCITSNDPASPVNLMPVELNVVNLPSASISSGSETLEVEFGDSGTEQVIIRNTGLGELMFSVVGGQRGGLLGTLDLIYDQTASQTTNGTLAIYDLDGPATWAVQAADDFAVPVGQTWTIDQVVANGFYAALVNETASVRVFFYADDDGAPGDEIAAFIGLVPSADNNGVLTPDLPASVDLGGGTYWVSLQPEMDYFDDGRWFWFQNADQVGNEFHWRNPGDGYGFGCTDWAPGSACGFANPDQSFQLFGQVADACEPISNVPWLSVDPTSGTVAPEGGEQPVDLIADASAVLPGEYSTTVCFETNDGANPLLLVDVTLTVTGEAPDAIFTDRFEEPSMD